MSMCHILRAADHRSMPWKNGGGVTTEIAVSPAGADMDAFDWRVSMARVDADGPFSSFPGIDRTLAILAGNGLTLAIGAETPRVLDRDSAPLTFAADQPTQGSLVSGPILDLNVMVRRSRFRAAVNRHQIVEAKGFASAAKTVLLLINEGRVSVSWNEQEAELGRRDCLMLSHTAIRLRVTPHEQTELFFIELGSMP